MLTSIVLLLSSLLMIVAAISAVWLIKYSRRKVSWVFISIAFILMAVQRVLQYIAFVHQNEPVEFSITNVWLGFLISLIMPFSVIFIGKTLQSLNRSETEKKETQSRFQTLFHNSSDEIFLADLNGNFIEVNQVACDTLEYTADELRKKNFRDIKTSRYENKVSENIRLILEKGKHVYETEHISKSGKVISLEVKSRLIDYQGQKAFFSIARDITERKQMQQKIISEVIRAEENERERIAREMHDDLGPLLSTIKLYASELKSEDLNKSEMLALVSQTNELIDEAVTTTRTISNNLTPAIIHDFGLIKAIESFCKKLNRTQKIAIKFDPPDEHIRFDQTIELILYRVFTELVNNTIKHADATEIGLALEQIDGKIQMTYIDNGKGFDFDKVLSDESKSGMGLKNIISRLRSVNGNYKFHSQKGKGILAVFEINITKRN